MARIVSRWPLVAVTVFAFACSAGPKTVPVTAASVRALLAATHEVDYPDEHFSLQGSPVVTADGHGGTLTAAIGERDPSADGKGMIVAFWHNATFVGFAQDFEVLAIDSVRSAGPSRFTVLYVNYRDSDPLCCPSGKPALRPIDYRWDGKRFVPDQPLPRSLYRPPAEHVVPPPSPR